MTRNHKLAVKSVEQQTIVKACRPGCTLQWVKGIGGVDHKRTQTGTVDCGRGLAPEPVGELERQDAQDDSCARDNEFDSEVGSWDEDDYASGQDEDEFGLCS